MKQKSLIQNRGFESLTRREIGLLAVTTLFGSGTALSQGHPEAGEPGVPRWRADFPALQQTLDGRRIAYLDSAATTHRSAAVIDALTRFYREDNANPSRALHTLARRAYERYQEARSTVASFIHARDPNEVVWVRGTTEAINLVAATWGRANLRAGDEVLLTLSEHTSNLLPWRFAAERAGANVRYVDLDDEGRLNLEDLERKLTNRTRIVALSHVSNVLGYVNPVTEVCARAHAVGARVLVDGAQSVPHIEVDVQKLDCDFLAFSSHKMTGPMGVGVLWARRELLEEMPPYQVGSNMAHDVDLESAALEHGAFKFGAGTPNVSGPVGLAAAIRYLTELGREAIREHEKALTERGLRELGGIRGLTLLGPDTATDRLPVFSFSLDGWQPQDVARELDQEAIAVRAGDLAAGPLLRRLGVRAAVRASCYLYTSGEEIDRLVAALQRLSTRTSGQDGGDGKFG
jgi:cysteine desulfurase/selenocysteine lyase